MGDKSVAPTFTQPQLEAIAGALGETDTGLTNAEIEFLFRAAKLVDPGAMTKRIRLYNAFAECQNRKKNRTNVLEFIRVAMNPARYSREPHRFEPIRMNLNRALAFAGLVVTDLANLRRLRLQQHYQRQIAAPETSAPIWSVAMSTRMCWYFAAPNS